MTELTSKQKKERLEMLKSITLKDVVFGRGHDCGGLIADIYFKRKMVATYHDDGWGGEPEVTFLTKDIEETIRKYIADSKVEEHMLKTDWDNPIWTKDGKGLGFFTVLESAVEFISSHMEHMKRVRKLQTNKLVLEKDGELYTKGFGMSMAKIKKNPRLLLQLKDIIKKEKSQGYELLNTNI